MTDKKIKAGLTGCGSHSCFIKPPVGMGTNGQCTCLDDKTKMQRYIFITNHEITSLREQLEIAKKDGWISVDTALPELRDDSVLAHFANGSIETIHIEDYFRQITDGFDSNGYQKYTRWYLHSNPLVTHWQPLPEPPKE